MDYLQYSACPGTQAPTIFLVLNLVINGLPSILISDYFFIELRPDDMF